MVRAVESHFRPNSKSNCAPSSSARHSFGSNGAFLNFAVHVTKDITRSLKSMIAIASNSDCSHTISHAGSGVLLTTLTRERVAEPSFGGVDLSAAFGKKVVFASFAAKQIAEPAVADQTKLGRAASVTFFTYGNLRCVRRRAPAKRVCTRFVIISRPAPALQLSMNYPPA